MILRYALTVAFLFSYNIYATHFNVTLPLITTMAGLAAIYLLLKAPKASFIYIGFFIGVAWFWWISLSFRYYDLPYLIPFVIIGFGTIYAIFFWLIGRFDHIIIRALLFFGLSWFEPFAFNWFKPEIIFVNSLFSISLWHYALIIAVMTIISMPLPKWRFFSLLALIALFEFSTPTKEFPSLHIDLVSTNIDQAYKWKSEYKNVHVIDVLTRIDYAVANQKELVIFPESAIPLFLNYSDQLIERLKHASFDIAIVLGALYHENGMNYNATYIFNQGKMIIAKKMVLVPFGEYTPLPKFLTDWINDTFFNGASDYQKATRPTDFTIGQDTFRNAICYEGTSKELFVNAPKFMITISNNAWFSPSIQPTLQKLLMKLYVQRYNTIIFHSVNGEGTGVIQ
jgi:apolipoprotein N-acyltransferase